jgi:large subunit ribosomal protein L5
MARLHEQYRETVRPALSERFGYANNMAVPRLEKICLNMGVGRAVAENKPKLLTDAQRDLTRIAGQLAIITRTRVAVAAFKTRIGYQVGVRVTLRGTRMYEFLDRLINVAMPRIRDFRGVSARSFDGRGNYSLGIEELIIFPEVDPDQVESTQGMDVTFVTSARSDQEGEALLGMFGFPFRDGNFALGAAAAD